VVFNQLEAALDRKGFTTAALGKLATELELLLPTPNEAEIDAAYTDLGHRLGIQLSSAPAPGKRVVLRMAVTLANTLSQPVVHESGVMRLPQTIRGLFDMVPSKDEEGPRRR